MLRKINFVDLSQPVHMNVINDLSEDIGIHVGDGCIYVSESKSSYQITYSMNNIEDFEYSTFIVNLKNRLFGIKPSITNVANELRLVIYSKSLVEFYLKTVGLPLGRKDTLEIPNLVLKNKQTKMAFLRGLFDTDFSLSFKKKGNSDVHKYPVIMSAFNNPKLTDGLYNILKSLGFTPSKCHIARHDKRTNKIYQSYQIYINGKKNLLRWDELIKSHNPRLITRYNIWKKYRFCPPNLSINQRYAILNGKLDPLECYKNKRPGSEFHKMLLRNV